MTVKYKTVITKAGAIKLAAATLPDGKKVNLTAMAIGDGGGTLPVPDPNQTKLVKEVWRHALNKISQDKKNKNYVVAELLIPPETGGFWVRELGLYDDTGTLIAVGNMAESYKPALAEGSGRAQTVRMVIMVSDIESVELTIDSSTVMATQDYVDDKIAEHEQSRRHPDATLTAKGFTQLSSATDSVSESVAATPKAVKAAYDLANGKYTAQDATTARKGIVQLSSATDSASETLAATPKAVKAAYDLASGKYTAQDATTARKGIVQLSSATDSASETLAATPKAVKAINDDLQKVKQTLGTASSCDVTASRYDATSGRVLQVGDYGLGVGNGAALLTSIYDIKCSGVYCAQGRGTSIPAEGMPDDSGNTRYSVFATSVYTNQYWVTLVSNAEYYVGNVNTVNKTSVWYRFYNKAYKPTAGDVGALPITGGALTGLLTVSNATPYIALRATGGDTRRYIMGFNSDGSSSFYVGKANVNSESCMLWNYTPGSGIEITADGKVNVNSKGRVSVFNTDGTFVPAAWTSFDSRYLALSGGTVTGATTFSSTLNIRAGLELYAPQPYIDFHFGNSSADYTSRIIENTSGNLYVIGSFSASKTITPSDYSNFDARYQAKGSYTPAGQAYTKAESNARYLQGWRLSAAATATNDNNDNLFADAPNGSVVVSVQQKTNYTAVKYRYAQYNLNGTWYNAGVAA